MKVEFKEIKIPKIQIEIYQVSSADKLKMWDQFKKEHYLSEELNVAATCWVATWNEVPIAFNSVLPLPHAVIKNNWKVHRLVVKSDYQGLGIGTKLLEYCGDIMAKQGKYYICKTANIKLGLYMTKSDKWEATSSNLIKKVAAQGKTSTIKGYNKESMRDRLCYSFRYVGHKVDNMQKPLLEL